MTYRLGDMLLELRDPNTPKQRVDEITRELNELGDRDERYRTILTLRGVIVDTVETPDGSVRIAPGQFFLGNGVRPGEGYSGIRMEYPAFEMDGEKWNLAGVENDTLQFGVRASDGKAIAGGGDVSLDNEGVWIKNQQGVFGFESTAGDRFKIYMLSDGYDALVLANKIGDPDAHIRFLVDTASHQVLYLIFGEDASFPNVPTLTIYNTDPGASAAKLVLDKGVILWAGKDGTETVFNEDSYDVDFRIESATDSHAFQLDAGLEQINIFNGDAATFDAANERVSLGGDLATFDFGTEDRLEIGQDHYIPTRNSSNPTVYFNEANQDMDFIVEGTTDNDLLFVDAGNNRVGIGTNTPTDKFDVDSDTMRLRTAKTPTSTADSSGNVGSIAWDANYIYVKTGSGWKRAALSTF